MGSSSSPASTFLLIALMVVAFYFLIIRPNKKRQQAQQKTMSSLTPGTRVLLTSGVFATIVELGERQAVLETSPGVHLTVLKQAIARSVLPSDEDSDDVTDDDDSLEDGDLDRGEASGVATLDSPGTTSTPSVTGGSHVARTSSPDTDSTGYPSVPDHDPSAGTGTSSTPTKD